MPTIEFTNSYSVSYWGAITASIRLTFTESYTASTNKSVVTLTKIELKKDSTSLVGTIPFFGTLAIDGTTACVIDNSGSGKIAEVYLNSNSYCQVDLSNVTITPVTVTHNADGSKNVTIALSGGSQSRFCGQYAWYHQIGTDPNTGHALYRTDYIPFGISVPASGTMALTSHTRQWTVSYNANGGTGAPSAQTKTYGTTLTLSATTPTRASASSGSYTVTYNANGGSVSPASATAAITSTYTFSTWNTAANGSGTNYNPSGSYTANAAATLYAQWTSTTSTAAVTLPTPTRSGYTFSGWYTASSGGTRRGGGGDSFTPSANVTLYAQWSAQTSTIAASGGTKFGSTVTLTITRASSSFTHTVKTSCAGYTETLMTKGSSTSLSWTPAVATYAQYITNATSATATITCQTYSGSTLIGTSSATRTLSFNAADIKPTVAMTITDPNGYSTTYGKYVKGKSKIRVALTTSTVGGATVATTSISANGATYSSSPATTSVISSAGNTSVSATITDTRSQTTTASSTIQIYDYSPPTLTTFSAYRCNSDGTANDSGAYIRVDYGISITALGNHNSKTLVIKYKKTTASSYTTQTTITPSTYTATGNVHNIVADINSSYSIRLELTDDFTTITQTKNVPTAATHINHGTGSTGGIGIGKISEFTKTVDISSEWSLKIGNTTQAKEAIGLNDSGMNFTVSKLTSADQLGTLNWTVKNTAATDYVDHRVGLLPQTDRIYMYDYTGQASIWYIPADFITNAILNGATDYTSRTAAANAIWDSMEDGKQKMGRVTIGGSTYAYWAMRNTSSYAEVILTSYSNTIYKYVKVNGTVSGYAFTGTADS